MTNYQLLIVSALIEREGKILITRRHDPETVQWHNRWEFPGGKIEANETPLEALHREIKEETQLKIHSERLLGVHTHHWRTSKGIQHTFILLYHCLSNQGVVVLDPEENDDYTWEKPEAIMQRTDLLDGNTRMLEELFLNGEEKNEIIAREFREVALDEKRNAEIAEWDRL